jgi:hypothetical protein
MRCQHVDDDIQCRLDATRRVVIAGGDPPDPDQAGSRGSSTWVQLCKEHAPTRGARRRSRARQRRSINAPDGDGPGARRTIRRALRGAQT